MLKHAHVHQKSGFIQPRHTGSCRRCGGMVISTYGELLTPGQTGEAAKGWRCINCGEYVDGQVLRNRSVQEGMICVSPRDVQHQSVPKRAQAIPVRPRKMPHRPNIN